MQITVETVAPGVTWFHPPEGGEVYVLQTGDRLVLIDSGMPRCREAILGAMKESGIDPSAVELAFATHFHCDHVGALGWWREQHGMPIVAHELAVAPMAIGDPVVTGSRIPFADFHEPFIPCEVDHAVRGGEQFTVGDLCFDIERAPGHIDDVRIRW